MKSSPCQAHKKDWCPGERPSKFPGGSTWRRDRRMSNDQKSGSYSNWRENPWVKLGSRMGWLNSPNDHHQSSSPSWSLGPSQPWIHVCRLMASYQTISYMGTHSMVFVLECQWRCAIIIPHTLRIKRAKTQWSNLRKLGWCSFSSRVSSSNSRFSLYSFFTIQCWPPPES